MQRHRFQCVHNQNIFNRTVSQGSHFTMLQDNWTLLSTFSHLSKNCGGSCCSIYMHLIIDIRDVTVRKLCAPLESLLTSLRDYKTEKLGPTKPCSWPFAKWGDSNPALHKTKVDPNWHNIKLNQTISKQTAPIILI